MHTIKTWKSFRLRGTAASQPPPEPLAEAAKPPQTESFISQSLKIRTPGAKTQAARI